MLITIIFKILNIIITSKVGSKNTINEISMLKINYDVHIIAVGICVKYVFCNIFYTNIIPTIFLY